MKEYLPIGSVVLLKNGKKRIMIYGRRQLNADKVLFDYVACLYPEGNINDDYNFLFNNEDIDKVVFRGYSDEEDKEFIDLLNDVGNK